MNRNATLERQICAEAADWFVRLQDPDERSVARAEFVDWLLRSPQHVDEFLAVSAVWAAGDVDAVGRFARDALVEAAHAEGKPTNVTPLLMAARSDVPAAPEFSRWRGYRLATAASFVFVVVAVVGWITAQYWLNPAEIRTAIGEQRHVTLSDGSVVDVNTDSEVRIAFSRGSRRLQLLQGEARFKVAKDARRPFIVTTPQASIRALGTVFNVRAGAESTAVAVLEGDVEVRDLGAATVASSAEPAPVEQLELHAGQQAAINPTGHIVPDGGPPIDRVAAWTQRRLVFREASLADVVAEFNRYHRRPIRIRTPALEQLRISGTFDSRDADSLLEYFEHFENVRVERAPDSTNLY